MLLQDSVGTCPSVGVLPAGFLSTPGNGPHSSLRQIHKEKKAEWVGLSARLKVNHRSQHSQFTGTQFTMFASLLLLWLVVFFFLILFKSQRSKNFPPGPTVLPIVGNIFHVNLENPLKDFEKVSKSY